MSIALIRFAFLCTLLSVSNPALAEEKGAAAGAITGGIAGALVGGPVGAIIGAGIGGVAGGALTSPAAVQVEQPSSLVRERVLVRRPVPTQGARSHWRTGLFLVGLAEARRFRRGVLG